MTDEVREFAAVLRSDPSAGDSVYIRRGVVTATGTTYTVTIGGASVPGVRAYAHVTSIAAGSKVDVLFDGDTPVILGILT